MKYKELLTDISVTKLLNGLKTHCYGFSVFMWLKTLLAVNFTFMQHNEM